MNTATIIYTYLSDNISKVGYSEVDSIVYDVLIENNINTSAKGKIECLELVRNINNIGLVDSYEINFLTQIELVELSVILI